MAALQNPRPTINFLTRYLRLSNINQPKLVRRYSARDYGQQSYRKKQNVYHLWNRRRWNMTSDDSIFWRRNPSDTETYIVLSAWLLAGFPIWFVIFRYLLDTDLPPEFLEDLEDVADSLEMAGFALPSASKSPGSHYRKLLYRNDVRILVLQPGNFHDDIQFHMAHICLWTRHPKYEALSYAWGNQAAAKTIYHSDIEIPVTANLHSALQHLRYQDRARRLWVDAICIDQNDIDERNQQVRLMGDVFSEADRVVVWLGKKGSDTDSAMSSIKALFADFWSHGRESPVLRYILWSKNSADKILRRSLANSKVGETSKSNLNDLDWDSIKNLLRRAWFHRLWVIQEVSHAKRAIVVCGDIEIPWTILSRALTYLVDNDLTSKHLDRYCTHACQNVVNMEKMRLQKTRDCLFTVILANTYGGCADPRDKIFAMMSISEGRDIFDWEVSFDYSLPVTELYKRFAIWDVVRYKSLRSLSCSTTGLKVSWVPPPLPSWVPDWTRLLEQNLLVGCKATSQFAAALNTETDIWFTHNETRMHVRGAVVDHIHIIGLPPNSVKTTSVFEVDETVISQLMSMNEWLLECWNIARAGQTMTRATYEAFWRTMLCGLTRSGRPVPREYSKYFLQYFTYLREAPETLERYLNHSDPVAPCHLSIFEKFLVRLRFPNCAFEISYRDNYSWALHQWFNKHFKTNTLIEESLQMWGTRKRFCRTEDGRLARVPENAAAGDSICVLHGSEVPYVIRLQEDGTFTVIGECYVHGIMHGEALWLPSYQPRILTLQ